MLVLEDEVDVSRGDLLARPEDAPEPTRRLDAVLCWLSERPLTPQRRYVVRHATRESKAQVVEIAWRVDLAALAQVRAETLAMNDIGRVSLRLAAPLPADAYRSSRATGAFIVVDEASNDTVGAGMIL
jgi:sulfate adenylyltransferase subunit 1